MSTVHPARLNETNGRRWWLCPNCGQKMGEVIGLRVIVVAGERQIRMPTKNQPEQDCPKCGQASVLDEVAA